MRMWMLDPKFLCRQHLLGEHVEIHRLVGSLSKGNSIQGYLDKGLVEPQNIKPRHNELVAEMLSRGYNHNSPITQPDAPPLGSVSLVKSLYDLVERCPECEARIYGQRQ